MMAGRGAVKPRAAQRRAERRGADGDKHFVLANSPPAQPGDNSACPRKLLVIIRSTWPHFLQLFQNSSSMLTLVLWPAITIERFETGDTACADDAIKCRTAS